MFALHSTQEEYIALACASGEWFAAVQHLLSLGSRAHVWRATLIVCNAVALPSVKVR